MVLAYSYCQTTGEWGLHGVHGAPWHSPLPAAVMRGGQMLQCSWVSGCQPSQRLAAVWWHCLWACCGLGFL